MRHAQERCITLAGFRGHSHSWGRLLKGLSGVAVAASRQLYFFPCAGYLPSGHRSLLDNLASAGVVKPAAAPGAGSGGGASGDGDAPTVDGDDVEVEVEVPEALEEIIDLLVTGLRDRDTVVRWSAAKGVGRITGRLPKEYADDVVAAVLQLLRPEESDGAWHGGYASCACLDAWSGCRLATVRA